MFVYLVLQSRVTQQWYCVCVRGICDISYRIEEKVINVESLLIL